MEKNLVCGKRKGEVYHTTTTTTKTTTTTTTTAIIVATTTETQSLHRGFSSEKVKDTLRTNSCVCAIVWYS